MSWLRTFCGVNRDFRRRQIRHSLSLVEPLESRELPAAVDLMPGDIIMERNYRPAGSEDVDSGFLIYHPATMQTTPLVVPRLNDPGNINYAVYVSEFELTWETVGEVQHPHLIISGGVVPDPAFPGDSLSGLFDFGIDAGTLTSIHVETSSGGRPGYSDFAINADGLLARTRSSDRVDVPQVIGQSSIQTPDGSITYFDQEVSVVEEAFAIAYNYDGPTSSLVFDSAGTLYGGFTRDDGFFNLTDDVHTIGNETHNPGIYRLNAEFPRELIYDAGAGRVYLQCLPDGSIIALVGDDYSRRYYKQDIALERVVRIDPITKTVQTLFVGVKKFDYEGIQLDSSGTIFLGATDNSKDGNSNVFKLVTNGKKQQKTKAVPVFQDDAGGNASYGVVTSGNILVVKATQPPLPEASDVVNAATRQPLKTRQRGHNRSAGERNGK